MPTLASSNYGYKWDAFQRGRGGPRSGGRGRLKGGTIKTAAKPPPPPSARQGCRPLSEAYTTLLYNPRRQPRPFFYLRRSRHHNPRPEGPSNLRTLRTLGAQPRQPSHRRCVQRRRISFPRALQGTAPPVPLPGNRCRLYRCIRWHRRGRKPLSLLRRRDSFPEEGNRSPRW